MHSYSELRAKLKSLLEIKGKNLIQKHYISNIIYENIGKRGRNITFQTLYTLQEQEIEIKNKNPIENLNRRKKKCNNV